MKFFIRLADILFPPKDMERLVRELSAVSLGRLVSPVVLPGGAVSLLPYRHPSVRALIIEAKFKQNPKALSLLSGVLSEYVASLAEDSAPLTNRSLVLVPVPLGPARLKERGYNQVEEIAKRTGFPLMPGVLTRVRDTAPQTSLKRKERLQNMEGAFAASGSSDSRQQYLVIDDVLTTGATLESAAKALAASGVQEITLLTLAH